MTREPEINRLKTQKIAAMPTRNSPLYHGRMPSPSNSVAAMLLNGGASRRMGRDKSQLLIDGSTLAARTASLLLTVVETAIEVGPGVSGLPSTLDDPPGQGPLAGVAAGCRALRALGHDGGALVVACDLPFLSATLLRFLVEWDSSGSLVPVVRGIPQPLCARWGERDLDRASEFLANGHRSLRHLTTQPGVVLLDESGWKDVASEEEFFDVDSPDDLLRLGLAT